LSYNNTDIMCYVCFSNRQDNQCRDNDVLSLVNVLCTMGQIVKNLIQKYYKKTI
jgi:hypothetical protein